MISRERGSAWDVKILSHLVPWDEKPFERISWNPVGRIFFLQNFVFITNNIIIYSFYEKYKTCSVIWDKNLHFSYVYLCLIVTLGELFFSPSSHAQTWRFVNSAWFSYSRQALDCLHELQVTHAFILKMCINEFSPGFESFWS